MEEEEGDEDPPKLIPNAPRLIEIRPPPWKEATFPTFDGDETLTVCDGCVVTE